MHSPNDLPTSTPVDVSPPRGSFWFCQLAELRTFLQANSWAVVSLVILTVVLYVPTLQYDFLNWDDSWYIVNNDLIKSWHPVNLYKVMTEPVARNFAPLTIGMFLVEHRVKTHFPNIHKLPK